MIIIQNPRGTIEVSEKYFARLICEIASRCYGIAAMSSEVSGEDSDKVTPDELSDKDIRVFCSNGNLSIEMHIVVSYGVNIKSITKSIMQEIKYSLENMTGLKIERIIIFVDSIL